MDSKLQFRPISLMKAISEPSVNWKFSCRKTVANFSLHLIERRVAEKERNERPTWNFSGEKIDFRYFAIHPLFYVRQKFNNASRHLAWLVMQFQNTMKSFYLQQNFEHFYSDIDCSWCFVDVSANQQKSFSPLMLLLKSYSAIGVNLIQKSEFDSLHLKIGAKLNWLKLTHCT